MIEEEPFDILAVCTGNISRSPTVEKLLNERFWGTVVHTSSAGVGALAGHPMDAPMAAFVAARGVDPAGFAGRQVDASMVRSSGLVLGLERGHRADLVELAPAAVRRVFTLREFARLLQAVAPSLPADAGPATRLRAALPLAVTAKLTNPPKVPEDDDVVDPYREPREVYEIVFSQILDAVDTIARVALAKPHVG